MNLASEILSGFTAMLEKALNTAVSLDPETLQRLEAFAGKVIAIELQGFNLTFYLLPAADGFTLLNRYAGEADTTLSGTPLGLAEMALGPDAGRVLFSGEVTIRGDVELGQKFKRLLDDLDIDWEEQLSHLTGDIAAHKLGDLFRATGAWGQQAIGVLGRNTAEYLQQESRDLPMAEEVAAFNQEVDTLRDDVARLDARIARLQQQLHNGT